MSASREKKTRQELAASGYVDPRAQRAAEEEAKARRTTRLYTGIIIAFVVLSAALIVWNTGLIQRGVTAYTVDGESFTASEMSYYYNAAYQNFYSQYGSYAAYFFDTSISLRKQTYTEDLTWFDYFAQQGEDMLNKELRLVAAANAEGYTDDEYVTAQEEYQVALVQAYADRNGVSFSKTLKAYYGDLMTEDAFRACVRRGALATSYQSAKYDSFSYTDEQILATYQADPNQYDTVDIEYSVFEAAIADDATEEEIASQLELTQKLAESALKDPDKMETVTTATDGSYYHNAYATYGSASDVLVWAFDDARVEGDTAVIDMDGEGYYAVRFHGRSRADESPVSVRHILVEDEDTANEILTSYLDGEQTEAAFAALAMTYSTDSGSSSSGGLYSDFYYGQMVDEFEDWSFDSARKAGDTGIVKTDYGYHVMYFVERNDQPYWIVSADSDLREADYDAWYDGVVAGEDGVEKSGMNYVG